MTRKSLISAAILLGLALPQALAAGQAPASQRDTAAAQGQPPGNRVALVIASSASLAERSAVEDFALDLRKMYPQERFELRGDLPASGRAVLVGSVTNDDRVRRYLKPDELPSPEGFVVRVVREGSREIGIIAGADPRGTAYGVYAMLEKLGCGFYLSYDALPLPSSKPFSFEGWQLKDAPLVRDRVVFDWHNFLSGCSAWNLADWQRWIAQARKMRFNGVMVHAYGNNPMVRFTFAGAEKPIGYLSTTQRGRDWATNHVNDVRRLLGGGVFDGPVFGAAAGMAPEAERGPAAETLMQQVFRSAQDHGMDVVLAVDVDTASSNPQPLILKLPQSARFAVEGGSFWLVNPETPDGYAYYKAQVQALLQAYPQIAKLVIWFRQGKTPWMALKTAEMPQPWQDEYRAAIAKTPEAAKFAWSENLFALNKIAVAFDRALEELGRKDIELCAGTWRFTFLPAADRFLPPKIKLYALDYEVLHGRSQLADETLRQAVRAVAEHRPVVPVAWAHHDDGAYTGRPYTPFDDFQAKLADCRAAGFGIIHWTTRPLDLYFASLARQVWQQSRNQPLRTTCEDMAACSFGPQNRAAGGEYLYRWVTEGPIFGRETGDRFIDRKLENVDQVVAGCRDRLRLLERVDTARLGREQKDRLACFRGLEEFYSDFFRAHEAFQRSQDAARQGDFSAAVQAIAACEPGGVIEKFAACSSQGGITRGEQGLIVSLNLRWQAHIASQRQSLGLEPTRYRLAPTSHDPLAQSPGRMSFFVDADRQTWQCLGQQELDAAIWTLPPDAQITLPDGMPPALAEVGRAGVESDRAITISLGPIFSLPAKPTLLRPGRYRVTLVWLDPSSTAPGQRVFEVAVAAAASNRSQGTVPIFRGAASAATGTGLFAAGHRPKGWSGTVPLAAEGDRSMFSAIVFSQNASSGRKMDQSPKADRIDIFQETGRPRQVLLRHYDLPVDRLARVSITLTPKQGKAVLSAALLEPLDVRGEP